MKKIFSDYTRGDLISFVAEVISAQGTKEHQDDLLELFIELTEHPEGSDLIYYSPLAAEATPKAIADKVQGWHRINGKPGFREE